MDMSERMAALVLERGFSDGRTSEMIEALAARIGDDSGAQEVLAEAVRTVDAAMKAWLLAAPHISGGVRSDVDDCAARIVAGVEEITVTAVLSRIDASERERSETRLAVEKMLEARVADVLGALQKVMGRRAR